MGDNGSQKRSTGGNEGNGATTVWSVLSLLRFGIRCLHPSVGPLPALSFDPARCLQSSGFMRSVTLPLPVLGFVVSTRAALAAGLALRFSDRVPAEQRRRIALTLIAIGAATTIPAAWWVSRAARRSRLAGAIDVDRRLIGATRYPRKGDDRP